MNMQKMAINFERNDKKKKTVDKTVNFFNLHDNLLYKFKLQAAHLYLSYHNSDLLKRSTQLSNKLGIYKSNQEQ